MIFLLLLLVPVAFHFGRVFERHRRGELAAVYEFRRFQKGLGRTRERIG